MGLLIGTVGVFFIYVLLIIPYAIYYLKKNTMSFTQKKVWMLILGTMTPLWIYLPYYLYKHGIIMFSI